MEGDDILILPPTTLRELLESLPGDTYLQRIANNQTKSAQEWLFYLQDQRMFQIDGGGYLLDEPVRIFFGNVISIESIRLAFLVKVRRPEGL